jgi:hypothetical protein
MEQTAIQVLFWVYAVAHYVFDAPSAAAAAAAAAATRCPDESVLVTSLASWPWIPSMWCCVSRVFVVSAGYVV